MTRTSTDGRQSRRIPINWAVTGVLCGAIAAWMLTKNLDVANDTAFVGLLAIGTGGDNVIFQAKPVRMLPRWGKALYFGAGLLISTAGVQFAVPVLIISAINHMGFVSTAKLGMFHSAEFGHLQEYASPFIQTGAAMFLGLLFLTFMLDPCKEHHWLHWAEKPMARWGQKANLPIVIMLLALVPLCFFAPTTHREWLWGIVLCSLLAFLLFQIMGDGMKAVSERGGIAKGGSAVKLLAFLMVLSSVTSIDSLASAFVVTNNIVAIVVGLVVGDLVTRALILHVAESDFLSQFHHVEVAAYWTMGWLALTSYLGVWGIVLPDMLVSGVGTAIIVAGLVHSHLDNRRARTAAA